MEKKNIIVVTRLLLLVRWLTLEKKGREKKRERRNTRLEKERKHTKVVEVVERKEVVERNIKLLKFIIKIYY